MTPAYERLHKELLKRYVLHADETTLQVLHELVKVPQSESYMWLYRTSGDTDKPIVLYEYQPGRGAKYPKEFLAGYTGISIRTAMTDIIIWDRISLWLAVGHICAASSTRR